MTFDYLNRFGKLWKQFSRAEKRRTRHTHRVKRLRIEFLERRALLATVTWDGGSDPANFNWLDKNNWDTNTVPTLADDVVIPDLTDTPTIFVSNTAAANSVSSNESIT